MEKRRKKEGAVRAREGVKARARVRVEEFASTGLNIHTCKNRDVCSSGLVDILKCSNLDPGGSINASRHHFNWK